MGTSENFVRRYLRRAAETKSVLCVGLDPTPEHVPPTMQTADIIGGLRGYLFEVVNIAARFSPVIKPQFAYYAALGESGLTLLADLVRHAHSIGLLVILDAKRPDIGETMEQYGNEVFGHYGVDACTSVPYLGPTFNPAWMEWFKNGRMAITMIRTSNPEAEVVQDLPLASGLKVYEHIAQLAAKWHREVAEASDGAGGVGGVVGATWPTQALNCRRLTGDEVFFLTPGYGAQGGGADGAVAGLPNSRGELMGTVNSSRGITLASWWDKKTGKPRQGDPLKLVEDAIMAANKDLNAALERKLDILAAQTQS